MIKPQSEVQTKINLIEKEIVLSKRKHLGGFSGVTYIFK